MARTSGSLRRCAAERQRALSVHLEATVQTGLQGRGGDFTAQGEVGTRTYLSGQREQELGAGVAGGVEGMAEAGHVLLVVRRVDQARGEVGARGGVGGVSVHS